MTKRLITRARTALAVATLALLSPTPLLAQDPDNPWEAAVNAPSGCLQ